MTEEKIKGGWYLTSFAAVLAILNVFEVSRSLIWSRKAKSEAQKSLSKLREGTEQEKRNQDLLSQLVETIL